jgi:hypothetical protein
MDMAIDAVVIGEAPPLARVLAIDLLVLDLTTCHRCLGADERLTASIELVRDVLSATGVEVEVRTTVVGSAEQATALRFRSSPTIRVDGRDVALELRESACGSEACTDGCGETIACRVWVHRGVEHTEPPVGMIVEAILGHVYGDARPAKEAPYELPDNLARFYAGRATSSAACCASEEREICCEPEAKQECCGDSSGGGCGCR